MIMAAKYPELVNKLVIWGTRAFLIDEDMDGLRGEVLCLQSSENEEFVYLL